MDGSSSLRQRALLTAWAVIRTQRAMRGSVHRWTCSYRPKRILKHWSCGKSMKPEWRCMFFSGTQSLKEKQCTSKVCALLVCPSERTLAVNSVELAIRRDHSSGTRTAQVRTISATPRCLTKERFSPTQPGLGPELVAAMNLSSWSPRHGRGHRASCLGYCEPAQERYLLGCNSGWVMHTVHRE
jgi:hypothetical protein